MNILETTLDQMIEHHCWKNNLIVILGDPTSTLEKESGRSDNDKSVFASYQSWCRWPDQNCDPPDHFGATDAAIMLV